MSSILSVQKSTSYERRFAITLEADRRQERLNQTFAANGFRINWTKVLQIGEGADHPLSPISQRLDEELSRDAFADTVLALTINGRLLAAYIQRKHERLIGLRVPVEVPLGFAEESEAFTPKVALEYWQRLLGLTDEEIETFRLGLGAFHSDTVAIRGRIRDALVRQLLDLHAETLRDGVPMTEFIKRASEIMPDRSRSALEGEYRTELTKAYGGARHELIVSRSRAFPFTQFFAIIDGRTTWYICLPMGTAGPGEKGYIAASDDPLWFIWRPPNHWGGCRSDLSPIGYRECIRLGILDAQGRKLALVGNNPNRPFGEPPRFVQDPKSGTIRRVEPQLGFGA